MGEIKVSDIAETAKIGNDGFKEIKPENNCTLNEAKEFIFSKFNELVSDIKNDISEITNELGSEVKEFYGSKEERFLHCPVNGKNGYWTGERGDSIYIPFKETENGLRGYNKLKEYGLDGITYKNGEPNFSPVSEGTVEIENMTGFRHTNFKQADIQLANQWNQEKKNGKENWTDQEINAYRKENHLSWHECCDTKTMMLLSQDIHGGGTSVFSHWGGCAECNKRDNQGGMFDE